MEDHHGPSETARHGWDPGNPSSPGTSAETTLWNVANFTRGFRDPATGARIRQESRLRRGQDGVGRFSGIAGAQMAWKGNLPGRSCFRRPRCFAPWRTSGSARPSLLAAHDRRAAAVDAALALAALRRLARVLLLGEALATHLEEALVAGALVLPAAPRLAVAGDLLLLGVLAARALGGGLVFAGGRSGRGVLRATAAEDDEDEERGEGAHVDRGRSCHSRRGVRRR